MHRAIEAIGGLRTLHRLASASLFSPPPHLLDGDISVFPIPALNTEFLQGLLKAFYLYIQFLKSTPYLVSIEINWEGNFPPLNITWNYSWNGSKWDNVVAGSGESQWIGLNSGETAYFSYAACLYMKSYGFSLWDDTGWSEVLMPENPISQYNAQEENWSMCSEEWIFDLAWEPA